MLVTKEISPGNELYVYLNGKLIYKRWLNTGQSKVFDVMAYDKYTYASYTDLDIKDSPYLISVKAKVRFLTAHEGGRTKGIFPGYRPNHVFEYEESGVIVEAFMGDIGFHEQDMLDLGRVYEVLIRFPLVQRIERFMNKGRKWDIHEGTCKVGDAEIIAFEMPIF